MALTAAVLLVTAATAAPHGGYRHFSGAPTQQQVSLSTDALALGGARLLQPRLSTQLGGPVSLGVSYPYQLYFSDSPLASGVGPVQLQLWRDRTSARIKRAKRNRYGMPESRLEVGFEMRSGSSIGTWGLASAEAFPLWRLAFRSTKPLSGDAEVSTFVAFGLTGYQQAVGSMQVTVQVSHQLYQDWWLTEEVDVSSSPLSMDASLTCMARRHLGSRLDWGVGVNLPLSAEVYSTLQLLSQIRFAYDRPGVKDPFEELHSEDW